MIAIPAINTAFYSLDENDFCSPQNLQKGILVSELGSNEKKTIYSLYQLELGKKYVTDQGHHVKRKTETEILLKRTGPIPTTGSELGPHPINLRSSSPINIVSSQHNGSVNPLQIAYSQDKLEGTSPFFIVSPAQGPSSSYKSISSNRGLDQSTNSSLGSTKDTPQVGSLSDDFESITTGRSVEVAFPSAVGTRSSSPDFGSKIRLQIITPNIPGEKIIDFFPEVVLVRSGLPDSMGTLYFTNYQLIFHFENEVSASTAQATETQSTGETLFGAKDVSSPTLHFNAMEQHSQAPLMVPFAAIARFDKIDRQNGSIILFGENSYSIEVHTKDFRRPLRFSLNPSKHVRRDVCNHLSRLIFPSLSNVFALTSEQSSSEKWDLFDVKEEFSRFGVGESTSSWRYSTVNSDYSLCSSYPTVLVVPSDISDEDLKVVASFRSKGRIPVLAWKNATGASLTRCSQPKTGMSRTYRCKQDETFLALIQTANSKSKKLHILDARPMTNAMANMAFGGGYENIAFYQNAELEFMGIPNIHVVRDSCNKLRDLCEQSLQDTFTGWHAQLEATHWLEYISGIMSMVKRIVELIDRKHISVLVHCSDGWDRTPQVCSLAQLCLDKYYRTVDGFCKLIEKEWLQFGHKFGERFGLNMEDTTFKDAERSPIFLQFLDATWQIVQQFPHAFEFTEDLLILLIEAIHSGRFGTFLLNSMREREKCELHKKTLSVWPYILQKKSEYINPFYREVNDALFPLTEAKNLHFWKSLYFRYLWDPKLLARYCNPLLPLGKAMKQEIESLQAEVKRLQQELQQQRQQSAQAPSLNSNSNSSLHPPPLPLAVPKQSQLAFVLHHNYQPNNNSSSLATDSLDSHARYSSGFISQPSPIPLIKTVTGFN